MLNFNNPLDSNPPNQSSPGLPLVGAGTYSAAGTGTTLIARKGPTTLIQAPAVLTGSIVLQFDSIANQAWKPGDVVIASIPTHTGGGFTTTVENIAGAPLATWPALLAAGGMFVFNGVDFFAALPGPSTT